MFRFKLWSHWAALPTTLRRAGAIAILVIVSSSALLYQTNVRGERPPRFSRGGAFAGSATQLGSPPDDFSIPTPTPVPTNFEDSRSSAVLSAPDSADIAEARNRRGPRFPSLANYVYAVDGYEEATAFGRRNYPSEMTTTVHRTQPTDPNVPTLKEDEVIFDLDFSTNHEEREIVAYREGGLFFTYEAGSVTFGPRTQTSEAVYDPVMLQIPLPLIEGTRYSGTSRAINNSGDTVRTEDWEVEILGREPVEIQGEITSTWKIRIDRQSRPDSSEQVTRTRTYWFDPERALWVRWEEKLDGAQDFGPGTFAYHTEFAATLVRIEPL